MAREIGSPNRAVTAITPQWASKTIRSGESTSSIARMQAVGVLGSLVWQTNAEIEGVLVFALRSDPSESVRAQVAAVFAKSKYVTPKVHDALQCCAVGSIRDGFAGERATAVKWQASEALKKHPTSGDPRQIASLQQQSAGALGSIGLGGPAGGIVRDNAEESSPPETLPLIPEPQPSAPKMAIARAVNPVAATPAASKVSLSVAVPASSLIAPPPPMPAAAKSTSKLPEDLPVKVPVRDSAIKTVSIPESPYPARPIPTTVDRTPATDARATLELPPLDATITLRQRRAELRDLGLQNPSIKLFTEQVSSPPPKTAPSSWFGSSSSAQSSGFLGNMFPTAPADEPTAPRAAPGTYVSRPNTPTSEDPAPKPGAWSRLFARFTPAPAEVVTAPPSESPGFLSRLLPSRSNSPTPQETQRPVDAQTVMPVSTNPVLRLP